MANKVEQREHNKTAHSLRRTRRAGLAETKLELQRVETLASELGLEIKVHESRGRAGCRNLHVKFMRVGWPVGEYWPTTGTLIVGNIRRRAESVEEALRATAQFSK